MKIKLKVLTFVTLGATLLLSPANAGTVDGISLIINKEPITLYDVFKYSQRFNLSKKEALDILVQQKLEESEIKKLGINIENFEVDQYIEKLAANNSMSQTDFIAMLKSKNIDIYEYKDELKNKLKRDKLYQKIVSTKLQQMGDGELKAYYNENLHEFSQASGFDVTIYTSANQESLLALRQNPMSTFKDVELKEGSFQAGKIDANLATLLNKTATNTFSTIVKSDQNYVMFYVKNKHNAQTVSLMMLKIIFRLNCLREKSKKRFKSILKNSNHLPILKWYVYHKLKRSLKATSLFNNVKDSLYQTYYQ
ncbi:MAG: SurA N-terminal domain-containing protein [Sulfurospirillum sp.]|nr:SurA N-terminal domain-containing protein [Sulfurospirillum sp.]